MFRPERDEVNRDRRRVCNEEIYDLCLSPNVIWVTKSRRRRKEGHTTHMVDRRGEKIFGGKTWGIETTWKT